MPVIPALYLVGAISPQNPVALSFLRTVLLAPKGTQGVAVYIDSPGGYIQMAGLIGLKLAPLRPVCYVKYAASAALQIVMPACAKIVMLAPVPSQDSSKLGPAGGPAGGCGPAGGSNVGYHSAAGYRGPSLFDAKEALLHYRESVNIARGMGGIMDGTFGVTVGCHSSTYSKYPETLTETCSVSHMVAETEMTGEQFKATHPFTKVPIELVRPEDFPAAPKVTFGEGGDDICTP